jgi:hypothetical protein
VSRYEWLLLIHVAGAFAMVAATVLFWTVILVTRRGYHPAADVLGKPANILIGIGSIVTLVFGIWLAVDQDAYDIWDFWIIAALVLWVISIATGQRAGPAFARAGAGGPGAAEARRSGVVLSAASTAALALLLADMIFKPWV